MSPFLTKIFSFWQRSVTKNGWAIALVVCAGNAIAGNPPGIVLRAVTTEVPRTTTGAPAQPPAAAPHPEEHPPAAAPQISYIRGQLTIHGLNLTLGEVLTKVSALTGMKLDFPAAAGGEHMTFVEIGPGPAREVLASLLSESNFDYMIQASDTDPDNIQSVVVMTRDQKGSSPNGNGMETARFGRGPFGRAAPTAAEETPASDSPAAAEPEVAAAAVAPSAETGPSNPPTGTTQQDQITPPMPPQPSQFNQPGLFNAPRPGGEQAVPANLNPQSISQQLQQMYQQRVQINQQERQTGPTPAPANPGNN